jgi:copper oxidase (laccase) domain-containing protein
MLAWEIGHGACAAMSLAADGDLRAPEARLAWCDAHGIPAPRTVRQVHGVRVAGPGEGGEADALVGVDAALAVFGADCPPLLIATPDALAAAHCGWRSTAGGIVARVVTALTAVSRHPPAAWRALVGPGVAPADYEVDAPVLEARSWPAGCVSPTRPGHAHLDLPGAVAADAAARGIGQVQRATQATTRTAGLRSHRRDGPGAPQMIVIWRTPCAG